MGSSFGTSQAYKKTAEIIVDSPYIIIKPEFFYDPLGLGDFDLEDAEKLLNFLQQDIMTPEQLYNRLKKEFEETYDEKFEILLSKELPFEYSGDRPSFQDLKWQIYQKIRNPLGIEKEPYIYD